MKVREVKILRAKKETACDVETVVIFGLFIATRQLQNVVVEMYLEFLYLYTFVLSDPGIPGVRFMGPVVWNYVYLCADLTDVTLADEDTNSILTDNANRAIQGNVAMQIIQSACQL